MGSGHREHVGHRVQLIPVHAAGMDEEGGTVGVAASQQCLQVSTDPFCC